MTKTTKPKLNKNVKLWLKALRSGEYKQVKGRLRTEEGYCCLGVACDVYAKQHKTLKWRRDEEGDIEFSGASTQLPDNVRKWLGLKDSEGEFNLKDGHEETLTNLNDDEEKSFEEIADIIESNPDGLFTGN